MSKTINSLTTEELIAALDGDVIVTSGIVSSEDTSIDSFIMQFKLQAGDNPVSADILYQLYSAWCNKTVTKRAFTLIMRKYFPFEMYSIKTFYLLNISAIETSKKYLEIKKERTRNLRVCQAYQRSISNFLEVFNIKRGSIYVESGVLYRLYDDYVYNGKKKTQLTNHQFATLMSIQFKTKRLSDSKVTWFGVDESIYNHLTEEKVKAIREGLAYGRKTKETYHRKKEVIYHPKKPKTR